jgi:hypothetical protein
MKRVRHLLKHGAHGFLDPQRKIMVGGQSLARGYNPAVLLIYQYCVGVSPARVNA